MKEVRLLAAPVIVKDGRITISTYTLKLFDHDDSRLTPADNIIIHLDPSKEPKFSPHPSGGWCSPPYAVIGEAEKAGVELEDIEIIKCKCQKVKSKIPAFLDQDLYSLEQCGHTSECPKSLCHTKELLLFDTVKSAPPFPGQLVSVGAADAKNSPVQSTPNPPKTPAIPAGGLSEKDLDNLVQALSGSKESVASGLLQMKVKPGQYDHALIASQLVRYADFTTCQKCGSWSVVNDINNPRCKHFPNCGG